MSGELIHSVDRLTQGLVALRKEVEDMEHDELVALYHSLNEMASTTWYVRCVVVGTAREKAHNAPSVAELAKEFDVSERMIQIDLNIWDTFIRDDPEFAPQLPLRFYLAAARTEKPKEMIQYALERKAAHGRFSVGEFERVARGEVQGERIPPGKYLLTPVEESGARLVQRGTKLWGRMEFYSDAETGEIIAEVR